MTFTRATELRFLSTEELGNVARLLNQTFAWKKLMASVPSELAHLDQQKYNVDHIKIIENVSLTDQRAPAEIFLDEWATSGEMRPTLSHLLELLIKCELFRAADYVAVKLLCEEEPERPKEGPAARVNIALPLPDDCAGVTSSNELCPHTSRLHAATSRQSVGESQIPLVSMLNIQPTSAHSLEVQIPQSSRATMEDVSNPLQDESLEGHETIAETISKNTLDSSIAIQCNGNSTNSTNSTNNSQWSELVERMRNIRERVRVRRGSKIKNHLGT